MQCVALHVLLQCVHHTDAEWHGVDLRVLFKRAHHDAALCVLLGCVHGTALGVVS